MVDSPGDQEVHSCQECSLFKILHKMANLMPSPYEQPLLLQDPADTDATSMTKANWKSLGDMGRTPTLPPFSWVFDSRPVFLKIQGNLQPIIYGEGNGSAEASRFLKKDVRITSFTRFLDLLANFLNVLNSLRVSCNRVLIKHNELTKP